MYYIILYMYSCVLHYTVHIQLCITLYCTCTAVYYIILYMYICILDTIFYTYCKFLAHCNTTHTIKYMCAYKANFTHNYNNYYAIKIALQYTNTASENVYYITDNLH